MEGACFGGITVLYPHHVGKVPSSLFHLKVSEALVISPKKWHQSVSKPVVCYIKTFLLLFK